MSFIIFDGFEGNTLARWDASGGIATDAVIYRTGSYSMEIYRAGWLKKGVTLSNGVCFGFAFYDPGSGAASRRIIEIRAPDGSLHGGFGYNAASHKFYSSNTGGGVGFYTTNAINVGTWYHIEGKFIPGNATAGWVELKIDGTQELYDITADYKNGASTDINEIRIGSSANSNEHCYFDDIYWLSIDGSGSVDYLGDCIVHAALPDADGSSSEWTRSGGSTDYENIDEGDPNDDTDYLYTPDGEKTVLVSVGTFSDVGREILAVQETLHTKKVSAGLAITCAPVCKSSTTTDVESEFTPVLGYFPHIDVREEDPHTSAAWTLTNLNVAEWGMKTTTGQYAVRSNDDLDNWLDDPGTVTPS